MEEIYDLVTIGAGPAGLICATEVAKAGHRALVLEEDPIIGEPENCGGLFNLEGLRRLGIGSEEFILNKVSGAVFNSGTKKLNINPGREVAAVVNRKQFDQYLAKRYIQLGGELLVSSKVTDVTRGDIITLKLKNKKKIKTRYLGIATGPDTRLAKKFGFATPSQFIRTVQYEISGTNIKRDYVELFLGSVAPGFFAWIIPTGEKRARVGLGVYKAEHAPIFYFERFIAKLRKTGALPKDYRVISKAGGLIPLFEKNNDIGKLRGNIFILGDCAGVVKATTGGGVMLGGLVSKNMGSLINNLIDEEIKNKGIAEKTENNKKITKELYNHLLIRKFANRLGDRGYERVLTLLKDPEILSIIEDEGDMEMLEPILTKTIRTLLSPKRLVAVLRIGTYSILKK